MLCGAHQLRLYPLYARRTFQLSFEQSKPICIQFALALLDRPEKVAEAKDEVEFAMLRIDRLNLGK